MYRLTGLDDYQVDKRLHLGYDFTVGISAATTFLAGSSAFRFLRSAFSSSSDVVEFGDKLLQPIDLDVYINPCHRHDQGCIQELTRWRYLFVS